ncbi:MBL fold metallo-hydrolase [Amycolatopsis granulosa]|uniref:MBL fold metallo-hydrolase n=1 Tax=Amycolatopsis granulosa TaxID=185684 RepID=UPI00141F45C9|nr:MBL fold metallo-hydrolase [Amycolatopsis granulosa]NIH85175.1 ribonuclease BN (tRNA processing enzyme) [Amycolatopsis granulosa]
MSGHAGEDAGERGTLGRRGLLTALGGAGLALGLAAASGGPLAAAAPSGPAPRKGHLEVVLLGTQAGPPPKPDRAGISTALLVDGSIYLIDCGRSSLTQFMRAGLDLTAIRSIFLTHLHIDHIADYYNYVALGGAPVSGGLGSTGPVGVYGPGSAGGLPPKFGGGTAPVVSPPDPVPGTRALTQQWTNAVAYSSNLFIRDSGITDPTTLLDVHEIALPDVGASFTNTAPAMRPFPVMSDDKVTVTAVLVPHGPVFPSFAFRFDTAYGSVTFSGDTTRSPNLLALAGNTDLLVHEAINLEGAQLPPALRNHMLESHVEVQSVGSIAEAAHANRLVLSHLVDFAHDSIDVPRWRRWAQNGYTGPVVVGTDLQRIGVA